MSVIQCLKFSSVLWTGKKHIHLHANVALGMQMYNYTIQVVIVAGTNLAKIHNL